MIFPPVRAFRNVFEQIGVMALLVCGFNFGLGYLLGGARALRSAARH